MVMLEGYTIGLPEEGLDAAGMTDASQHVPLLNCVANQVMGYYGNCMVLPFSIPASLAVLLNGASDDDDVETREPLTTAAVQEALTQFHREAFSPPESHFTLPTRGVLGEAVLGHCSSAEKIDLTRFWNWQDSRPTRRPPSPARRCAATPSSLQAPNTLSNLPTIINNVAEGSSGFGTLAQSLVGKGPAATDFSTDFLGQSVLTALGGKTIDSAESARKDALGSATQLAGKALDAGVDVFKSKFAADKAADEKKAGETKAIEDKAAATAKAQVDKQLAAVDALKLHATAFLGAAGSKGTPDEASAFATSIITGLAGGGLPPELAARLFSVFDQKDPNDATKRSAASVAWLTALGLLRGDCDIMADTDTTTADPAFDGLMDALVELIKSGVRPDVLEAQRLLLQRLAIQGDVFPARIPVPRNITEIGGYLNLLETAGHNDLRSSAIASALGIAGPSPVGEVLAGAVPVGFVNVANDRPAGPVQASIPPLLSIRADFHAPFMTAMATLHASGCQLPLRAPRAVLPATQPGVTPTGVDMTVAMTALGRTLDVFPGTVLVDPALDALGIARLETPVTDPVRLVALELDGGTLVPEASWVAMRASATTAVNDAPTLRRYLDVAPILSAAGWNHPQPLMLPTTLSSRGTLTQFINVTGLIAGETTLGHELELLYTPAMVARSAFASLTGLVWSGVEFAVPV
ncbi:MAG: hypothetical protein U5K74_13010 [Gemmatimonadaceae bacterium]|nr:hypothetical protein [Gemmatimonadaceae bacterium]